MKPWTTYPQWHGFTSKRNADDSVAYYCNYMSSYIYITQMALAFPNTTSNSTSYSAPSQPSYLSKDDHDNMKNIITGTGVNGIPWSTLLGSNTVNSKNKRLFVFGMALHTGTDIFAHCTTDLNGNYINHSLGADSVSYYPNRFTCASEFAKYTIAHMKDSLAGNVLDFVNVISVYNNTFNIPTYSGKAKLIDSTIYYNYSTKFDSITN